MRSHVWRCWDRTSDERRGWTYRTWCGRTIEHGLQGYDGPTEHDLAGADCLRCLDTLHGCKVRQVTQAAQVAEAAMERARGLRVCRARRRSRGELRSREAALEERGEVRP